MFSAGINRRALGLTAFNNIPASFVFSKTLADRSSSNSMAIKSPLPLISVMKLNRDLLVWPPFSVACEGNIRFINRSGVPRVITGDFRKFVFCVIPSSNINNHSPRDEIRHLISL